MVWCIGTLLFLSNQKALFSPAGEQRRSTPSFSMVLAGIRTVHEHRQMLPTMLALVHKDIVRRSSDVIAAAPGRPRTQASAFGFEPISLLIMLARNYSRRAS